MPILQKRSYSYKLQIFIVTINGRNLWQVSWERKKYWEYIKIRLLTATPMKSEYLIVNLLLISECSSKQKWKTVLCFKGIKFVIVERMYKSLWKNELWYLCLSESEEGKRTISSFIITLENFGLTRAETNYRTIDNYSATRENKTVYGKKVPRHCRKQLIASKFSCRKFNWVSIYPFRLFSIINF